MKSWITKTETYNDRDCCMEFNWVGNTMFSISRSRGSSNYLVQITSKGLFFNTDSIRMSYAIVKSILVSEVLDERN